MRELEVGKTYVQEVLGTEFYQKCIKFEAVFLNQNWYMVENTETGFRHVIAASELSREKQHS